MLANKFGLFQIQFGGLGRCNPQKILHSFPSFKLGLETVFPALKLTQNFYINMNILFSWKLVV